MAIRTATLPEELDRMIAGQLASGRYKTREEVMRAVQGLVSEEVAEAAKLYALREDVAVGWEQIERGEVVTVESAADFLNRPRNG